MLYLFAATSDSQKWTQGSRYGIRQLLVVSMVYALTNQSICSHRQMDKRLFAATSKYSSTFAASSQVHIYICSHLQVYIYICSHFTSTYLFFAAIYQVHNHYTPHT